MQDRLTPLFQGELSLTSRILMVAVAAALIPALFLPVWQITLHAPQYPGGLDLLIHSNTVAGDLAEVNILNHYIGMQEISPDEFPEFRFIPFFILRFLGFAALAALVARVPVAAIGYLDFVIFGMVMLYDFKTWLSDYGQNLSSDAPVGLDPFTPNLLGSTQVGNFEVTSWPAWGGILMVVAGALGPVILGVEWWRRRGEDPS
jgi:copper chaperone NosL